MPYDMESSRDDAKQPHDVDEEIRDTPQGLTDVAGDVPVVEYEVETVERIYR